MITILLLSIPVLDVELDIQYIPQRQNIYPLCLILVQEATTRRASLIVPFVINEIHFIGIKDIVKIGSFYRFKKFIQILDSIPDILRVILSDYLSKSYL